MWVEGYNIIWFILCFLAVGEYFFFLVDVWLWVGDVRFVFFWILGVFVVLLAGDGRERVSDTKLIFCGWVK